MFAMRASCANLLYKRKATLEQRQSMPVLRNPRHEAFAQAIFNRIVGAKGGQLRKPKLIAAPATM